MSLYVSQGSIFFMGRSYSDEGVLLRNVCSRILKINFRLVSSQVSGHARRDSVANP